MLIVIGCLILIDREMGKPTDATKARATCAMTGAMAAVNAPPASCAPRAGCAGVAVTPCGADRAPKPMAHGSQAC